MNITAELLTHGVFFRRVSGGEYQVECNWCNTDDYKFYESDSGKPSTESSWVARAAMHLTTYHPDEVERYKGASEK